MAKTAKHETAGSFQTVRNAKTGQFVTVRGVGALKGQLALKKSVDLTKPIASQALKGGKSSAAHKR
jgi:hypothetical protein